MRPPEPFERPPSMRPKLRIITDLLPAYRSVRRPIAIRHPALVKSAPLMAPDVTQTLPLADRYHWQRIEAQQMHQVPIIIATSPDKPPPPTRPARQGHKRTFSDKFKNLFSALHLKKEDRITFSQPDQLGLYSDGQDENRARKLLLRRPHRSPGTASFLVSRHLAPASDLPISATSSSTAFSISGRPSSAVKRYLDPHFDMDISHFSNSTTLASTNASSARSVSSGMVLKKSLGRVREGFGLRQDVSSRTTIKKSVSMPNVRVLMVDW